MFTLLIVVCLITVSWGYAPALGQRQVIVSITFDDGRDSQATAARVMATYGLKGTFFINSGTIGMPGYLTYADLESMTAAGHEIGGHTLTHPHLASLPRDEVARQICDDRNVLLDWGFAIRSFAYPFGVASAEDAMIARECGYNSARGIGTVGSATERVPPVNPMLTRAPPEVTSSWTATDLKDQVRTARDGEGWVQLTFHSLCRTECSDIATTEAVFEDFVAWLADEQAKGDVVVRTVGDVIGGPVRPQIPGPIAPPAAPGLNGITNPSLEEQVDGVPTCWTQGGFGANSPEFSLIPSAHSGAIASRLVMRDYIDGDAKLLQNTDLGACAPSVLAGRTYTIEVWYTATVPASFSVQYRLARGVWIYGLSSPPFPPAAEFTVARWTLPPIPQGVTGVSFGLALSQNGELVTDDYGLIDETEAP